MLRISRKGKKTKFLYRCKRKDVVAQIRMHLKFWSKSVVKTGNPPKRIVVDVPRSDFTAEWITHDDGGREIVELIPIPGT